MVRVVIMTEWIWPVYGGEKVKDHNVDWDHTHVKIQEILSKS